MPSRRYIRAERPFGTTTASSFLPKRAFMPEETFRSEDAAQVDVAAPGEQRRVAVVREGEDRVVLQQLLHAAGGVEDPADVPVGRPEPPPLRR